MVKAKQLDLVLLVNEQLLIKAMIDTVLHVFYIQFLTGDDREVYVYLLLI